MNFHQAEQEYQQLKNRFEQGKITPEEFESVVNRQLIVKDRFGRTWQIGVSSGKWYCYEKGAWNTAEPRSDLLNGSTNDSETPEEIWKPAPKAPIWKKSKTEPNAPAPEPEEDQESSAPAEPSQRKERIKNGLSWIMPISILIVLVIAVGGIGMMLMREIGFGWNPQTPARVGSPTPSPAKTSTPLPATPTPEPSATASPKTTQTPLPSATITLEPAYIPSVWIPLEVNYFNDPQSLKGSWQSLIDLPVETSFEEYQELSALKVQYSADFTLFSRDESGDLQEDHSDVLMEIITAFPEENADNAVVLICRTSDGSDGYVLRITRANWELIKTQPSEEIRLAQGETSSSMKDGGWGTMKLSCTDDQIYIWDETGQIEEITDTDFVSGQTAIRFEKSQDENVNTVNLYFHRLLAAED